MLRNVRGLTYYVHRKNVSIFKAMLVDTEKWGYGRENVTKK